MKESKLENEQRVLRKWIYLISSIILFIVCINSATAKFYLDYTGLSIFSLLGLIYCLGKWYENLNPPECQSEKEQKDQESRMNDWNKNNPDHKLQVSDNLKGTSALDRILNELEDMTPEKQEYMLDSEKRMSDDEIADYIKSKYKDNESL